MLKVFKVIKVLRVVDLRVVKIFVDGDELSRKMVIFVVRLCLNLISIYRCMFVLKANNLIFRLIVALLFIFQGVGGLNAQEDGFDIDFTSELKSLIDSLDVTLSENNKFVDAKRTRIRDSVSYTHLTLSITVFLGMIC